MPKAKIMVSIPAEMVAELDQAAKQEHQSRNEFVREALQLYIQVRKAIAVQDALAAADTARDWNGTYEIRNWRDRR